MSRTTAAPGTHASRNAPVEAPVAPSPNGSVVVGTLLPVAVVGA